MAKVQLKKAIGLSTLVAIGLSGIIGSGIFILPASMAAVAGPGMLLAIVLSGLIAAILALAYAELGSAFPLTGGPFSLPRLALGDLGGFLMGWGYFLYLFSGTAAVTNIFVVYVGFYIPGLTVGGALTPLGIAVAVLAIWVLTAINIFGIKWGGLYAALMTIARLIPLLFFAWIGINDFRGEILVPMLPFGMKGMMVAITLFFWSYTGFEALVVPLEEVKNPGKTIPWAMAITIFSAIVIYGLVGVAFLGMIDWKGLSLPQGEWSGLSQLGAPLAEVALVSHNTILAILISIGAILATGGASGSWILIQGRLPFAMARGKLFWKKMDRVGRFGTPTRSLVFSSLLTSLVIILIPHFASIALLASITVIVPYAAAALAVPILRTTKRETVRPFAVPFPHVLGALAFIFSTWLIYWAAWPWTLIGLCLFLVGFLAFFLVEKKEVEWKRNLWLLVYLCGITLVSSISGFKLQLPYDLSVLAFFALLIYGWAYRVNIR